MSKNSEAEYTQGTEKEVLEDSRDEPVSRAAGRNGWGGQSKTTKFLAA